MQPAATIRTAWNDPETTTPRWEAMQHAASATAAVLTSATMIWRGVSVLVAQAPVDPLLGGGGWASAGIFGLFLAYFLFRHLPAKDAQLEKKDKETWEMLVAKDERAKEMAAERNATVDRAIAMFQDQLRETRNAFEVQLREERHEARDALQAILLKFETKYLELAATFRDGMREVGQAIDRLEGRVGDPGHPAPPGGGPKP